MTSKSGQIMYQIWSECEQLLIPCLRCSKIDGVRKTPDARLGCRERNVLCRKASLETNHHCVIVRSIIRHNSDELKNLSLCSDGC
jgi:hypothetical protein